MNVPGGTRASAAYEAIRAAILDGRLHPGWRVTVRPLAEELGLSPTPIKTALAALEREGFLVAIAHRGYFVPEVSAGDMAEIYELREVIDGIAARRVTINDAAPVLARELDVLLTAQRRAVAAHDLSRYSELDLVFHRTIWQASGNRRLMQSAENLLGQVRLGSGTSSQVPGRLALALDEHAATVRAIRAGDPLVAEGAARAHVRLAGEALQNHLSKPED
ncbi:MAG: GntR family transcriptional regulator [Actinomycetes bacterium]